MLQQAVTTERAVQLATFFQPFQARVTEVDCDLQEERSWRRPAWVDQMPSSKTDILASRWIDSCTSWRCEEARSPPDRHVISIPLKATRLKLIRQSRTVFDGVMPVGMLHVTGPSESLRAEFQDPCDFVHFYVANEYFRQRQAGVPDHSSSRDMNDFIVRDALVEQLANSLAGGGNSGDGLYAEGVGHIVAMRLLALRRVLPGVSGLPKWRLRRVQDYVETYMDGPISLADLAAAAGLSRMYFAAQFRAATGYRPHEYVLHQRIERAKTVLANSHVPLAEVALNVGFQAQAHFSTVFKRLTGETPARWRQACRS